MAIIDSHISPYFIYPLHVSLHKRLPPENAAVFVTIFFVRIPKYIPVSLFLCPSSTPSVFNRRCISNESACRHCQPPSSTCVLLRWEALYIHCVSQTIASLAGLPLPTQHAGPASLPWGPVYRWDGRPWGEGRDRGAEQTGRTLPQHRLTGTSRHLRRVCGGVVLLVHV